MENNPFYLNEEDNQNETPFELFADENEEEDENQEDVTSKKKKKKFQAYFKDLFKKFLLKDSADELSNKKEAESMSVESILPIVLLDTIDDENEKLDNQSMIASNAFTDSSTSKKDVEILTDDESNHQVPLDHVDENNIDSVIPGNDGTPAIGQELAIHTMQRYDILEDKSAFPEKVHDKHDTHNIETVGAVMVKNLEKKRIKKLEKDVADVKKKLHKVEENHKNEIVHHKRNSSLSENHEKKGTMERSSREHAVVKKRTAKQEALPAPQDKQVGVESIRNKIEKQYKKIEEAIEEKVPAILQSKEYAALDILERTQPIYETYQEKYPPSSMKSVPLSTISGLDTLSQQYAVTRPNASKQKSIGLIGSTLPRDYKQAVRFGATYGVIFFVIFLLLIALRLI